jgi:hypothetical protein
MQNGAQGAWNLVRHSATFMVKVAGADWRARVGLRMAVKTIQITLHCGECAFQSHSPVTSSRLRRLDLILDGRRQTSIHESPKSSILTCMGLVSLERQVFSCNFPECKKIQDSRRRLSDKVVPSITHELGHVGDKVNPWFATF